MHTNAATEKHRYVIITILVVISAAASIFDHLYLHFDMIYPEFFYLPILLSGFWFGRRSVWLAVSLGAFLIIPNAVLYGTDITTSQQSVARLIDDVMRIVMFIGIGLIAGVIGETLLQSKINLRKANDFLENLINYSNAPVLVWDLNLNIIRVNNALGRMTGYDNDELLMMKMPALFPEKDKQESLQKIEQVLRDGLHESVEIEVACKNGEKRMAIWNPAMIFDEKDDRTASAMAQIQDITDRKRAEEELRHSNEFSQTVLESMGDAIAIIDVASLRVIDCNESFLKECNLSRDKVVGSLCYQVTHGRQEPCSLPDHICPVEDLLETKATSVHEHVHRVGEVTEYVEVSAYPIEDDDGMTRRVVHVSKDITEKKKAEAELAETQKRLMQSEKMAAIGSISSGIAHELNNPLMGISGYLYQIEEKLQGLDDAGLVEKAMSETKRCSKIIKDVLLFSRPHDIEESLIDYSEIIEKCEARNKPRLDKQGISHRFLTEREPIFIQGNETYIEMVIDNIIQNAIDAMEGVDDKVLELTLIKNGDRAVLTVVDSGIGIPENELAKVCEPFYTSKGPQKGTGLGMAISSNIIKAWGGELKIVSRQGKGTMVMVTMPVCNENAFKIRGEVECRLES